jgi:hypothetical protein
MNHPSRDAAHPVTLQSPHLGGAVTVVEDVSSGEWLSDTMEVGTGFPALLVAYQRSGALVGDPCAEF